MGTGAITSYVDVAQLVLYAFWIFFAGIIYYLLRENHRDGYPMDTDRGVKAGWPAVPTAKTFLMPNGHSVQFPYVNSPPEMVNGTPMNGHSGSPLEPNGNPMTAQVGPGSWAARSDTVDTDPHGNPRIMPLRAMPDYGVSVKDTDPRGLEVRGADGEVAGFVCDMWLDIADMLFRYIEVSLTGTGRKVLLPLNFARIKKSGVEVHALLGHQFADIPGRKQDDRITLLEEEKIVAYFGAGMLYATPARAEALL